MNWENIALVSGLCLLANVLVAAPRWRSKRNPVFLLDRYLRRKFSGVIVQADEVEIDCQ